MRGRDVRTDVPDDVRGFVVNVSDDGWTAAERAFADELALVQQRISALHLDGEEAVRTSRALRRAIAAGRQEPVRGRRSLARLGRSLDLVGGCRSL